MMASLLGMQGDFTAVITALIAVPVSVIVFYLRSLREHQLTKHGELVHRMDLLEESVSRVTGAISEVDREFATKEEWLRESMQARNQIEQLVQAVTRIEANLFDMPARTTRTLTEKNRPVAPIRAQQVQGGGSDPIGDF